MNGAPLWEAGRSWVVGYFVASTAGCRDIVLGVSHPDGPKPMSNLPCRTPTPVSCLVLHPARGYHHPEGTVGNCQRPTSQSVWPVVRVCGAGPPARWQIARVGGVLLREGPPPWPRREDLLLAASSAAAKVWEHCGCPPALCPTLPCNSPCQPCSLTTLQYCTQSATLARPPSKGGGAMACSNSAVLFPH